MRKTSGTVQLHKPCSEGEKGISLSSPGKGWGLGNGRSPSSRAGCRRQVLNTPASEADPVAPVLHQINLYLASTTAKRIIEENPL